MKISISCQLGNSGVKVPKPMVGAAAEICLRVMEKLEGVLDLQVIRVGFSGVPQEGTDRMVIFLRVNLIWNELGGEFSSGQNGGDLISLPDEWFRPGYQTDQDEFELVVVTAKERVLTTLRRELLRRKEVLLRQAGELERTFGDLLKK